MICLAKVRRYAELSVVEEPAKIEGFCKEQEKKTCEQCKVLVSLRHVGVVEVDQEEGLKRHNRGQRGQAPSFTRPPRNRRLAGSHPSSSRQNSSSHCQDPSRPDAGSDEEALRGDWPSYGDRSNSTLAALG